jgi:hypothetical protein
MNGLRTGKIDAAVLEQLISGYTHPHSKIILGPSIGEDAWSLRWGTDI